MGRKKIEIQPITHERNRSVTFLKSWHPIYIILMSTPCPHVPTLHPPPSKRKNGLFKKAYELGVLCSVDVAVIIFEERPGHHVKLYQYCSADINDIVQRHLRHDGEKDHKGPADFSGNNNPKIDDIGDDNDEDGDEDEDLPQRSKRGRDGKLKPPPDMHIAGLDYSHRSLTIPQAPSLSMHGIGPQNAGPGLPISSDRLSSLRNSAKRGRLDIHPHSRSPSDDPSNVASYYHPHNSATPFAAARQPPAYHHSSHHQGNPQYTPFFSPQSPPSFIQSGGTGHSSRAGQGYGLTHHAGASASGSYDPPPVYPNIMTRTGSTTLTTPTSGGSSGGLFPPFLDTDDQGRHQHSQTQQTGFGSLDWPVHNSGNSSSSGAHSSLPESVPNPPPSTDSGGQNSSSHWLDFLSTSTNSATSASTAREIMSWERSGGPPSNNSDLYVERGRPSTAGSPLIAGIVNASKRSPGGLLTSPLTGVNGRDDGNKEIPPS